MTIREQLISRSLLAHIVGFIYSINGNKFINSQTYHDLQVSVKAGHFIAAWFLNRSQTGLNNLLLMMIGSDLQEELHGILRTLSHNRNFSMLSLQHNLPNAQQMAHLFERNPKCRRKDRRRDSDGHDLCRVRDWAKDALVLSPTESLESLWMEGSCMGKTDLIQSKLFDCRAISIFFEELGLAGGSLLAPDGIEVGVDISEDDDDERAQTPVSNVETSTDDDAAHEPVSDFGITLQEEADEDDAADVYYCLINGQRVHKKTLVKGAFSTEQHSTDRMLRASGFHK